VLPRASINFIMLIVVMLNVVMLSVVMLSVVMLSVVMLNVVMLNVMAQSNILYYISLVLNVIKLVISVTITPAK
jgi:hypothetical protein